MVQEEYLKKGMAGNVQIWGKTILKIQEAQQTPNTLISKKSCPDTSQSKSKRKNHIISHHIKR